MGKEITGTAHDAEEFVEPVFQRTEIRKISTVPFPDERRIISGALNDRRDRGVITRNADGLYAITQHLSIANRFFQANREPGGIPSCKKTDAGRRANRCSGIGVREAHPFLREPIQMRRSVIGPTVTTQIAPAEIVGENENNIRTHSRCGRRSMAKQRR